MQSKNISISFSEYSIPEFRESYSGNKYVYYGKDNLYPDYLLSLYRRSPKHGSIIRNKAAYILGKGFKFKEGGGDEALLDIVNSSGESMNKVGKKCAIDVSLYGGFCLSITWTKGKKIGDVYHVDYHKVRSDKNNTEFYVKDTGWKDQNTSNKPKVYKAFNPEKPTGTQILYYKEYTPGLDTYTLPEYIQGLNYAEADYLVSEHTLSNAKSGFTASKMINFFNGEPTEEEKKDIEKGILKKYTGEKGSKIIISFNDLPEKAPQVLDLGSSDLTKEDFEQVDNLISQNLFYVHQVTSGMLFGMRVPGQLGGRNELLEAYEIYKNTYVDDKQDALAEVFNIINEYRGCPDVMLIPKEPIGLDVFNNNKLFELLPIEWIYEKIGLNPDDYPSLQKKIEEANNPPEVKEAPVEEKEEKEEQFSEDVICHFSEMGEPSSDYIVVKRKRSFLFNQEDVSAHEMMEFAEISQQESNIIDLIKKDKRITPEALAEALKLPVLYVQRILESLESKGLLTSKTAKVGDDKQVERFPTKETADAIKEKTPLTKEVFIRYAYEGPKDDRNRDFCHRLLELDRVYSRADIETISQRVGYSVWERRGGFYHNPNTGQTTPFCRHKWTQLIVIKNK
jgi:DNA-binding Lrp family transcriptional regulator